MLSNSLSIGLSVTTVTTLSGCLTKTFEKSQIRTELSTQSLVATISSPSILHAKWTTLNLVLFLTYFLRFLAFIRASSLLSNFSLCISSDIPYHSFSFISLPTIFFAGYFSGKLVFKYYCWQLLFVYCFNDLHYESATKTFLLDTSNSFTWYRT